MRNIIYTIIMSYMKQEAGTRVGPEPRQPRAHPLARSRCFSAGRPVEETIHDRQAGALALSESAVDTFIAIKGAWSA